MHFLTAVVALLLPLSAHSAPTPQSGSLVSEVMGLLGVGKGDGASSATPTPTPTPTSASTPTSTPTANVDAVTPSPTATATAVWTLHGVKRTCESSGASCSYHVEVDVGANEASTCSFTVASPKSKGKAKEDAAEIDADKIPCGQYLLDIDGTQAGTTKITVSELDGVDAGSASFSDDELADGNVAGDKKVPVYPQV